MLAEPRLKPPSPLRAPAEPRLKPSSPLRVRNGCFWRVFRAQRCRRFQGFLVGGEQWCCWFQRRHVVAPIGPAPRSCRRRGARGWLRWGFCSIRSWLAACRRRVVPLMTPFPPFDDDPAEPPPGGLTCAVTNARATTATNQSNFACNSPECISAFDVRSLSFQCFVACGDSRLGGIACGIYPRRPCRPRPPPWSAPQPGNACFARVPHQCCSAC